MQVLHVANGRLYGGIERMLTTLAASEGAGLSFAFAVCHDGRLAAELRAGGAEVHALGNVRLSRPASLLSARRRLRALLGRGRYGAVICHAPWSHALFGGVVRAAGAPVVLWQHDRATGRGLVERAARATRADLVICNSQWTARSAAAIQPGVPTRVVYCPVPAPVVSVARDRTRAVLGATAGDVVVLAVSRLQPSKGHVELLHALAPLGVRPWRLWIAGGAQRPQEQAYARQIADTSRALGIADRVQMLGERRDVSDLIAAADLVAHANVEPESFGLVFAEALLGGVPVVTADMGGAPEIVDASCGILVPPRDRAAMTRALAALMSNSALREALGAAGPAHAAARCTPAVVLRTLGAALASACLDTVQVARTGA